MGHKKTQVNGNSIQYTTLHSSSGSKSSTKFRNKKLNRLDLFFETLILTSLTFVKLEQQQLFRYITNELN